MVIQVIYSICDRFCNFLFYLLCGIFAYAAKEQTDINATQVVFNGLKKLEYRGYDSWGIAKLGENSILSDKDVGFLDQLQLTIDGGNVAIGHTRWATHGKVTKKNAHPHFSKDKSFVLVHNGVVENFQKLKNNLLELGYIFESETDSEVIVHTISECLKTSEDFVSAVKKAFSKLQGRNTILVLHTNGTLIGIRNGSPLILGLNSSKDFYTFSSDTNSISGLVEKYMVVGNDEMVVINNKKLLIHRLKSNKVITPKFVSLSIVNNDYDKGSYSHYMIKEIYETPRAIQAICNLTSLDIEKFAQKIKKSSNIYTIGSGSSALAAAQISYFLREHAQVESMSLVGADCDEYLPLLSKDSLLITPSQSGETADVLEFLEKAKAKGVKIASLVNMPGSMMTRMSDYKFMSNSGPEICVMTTKVLSAQMSWGYIVAKGVIGKQAQAKKDLLKASKTINDLLNNKDFILRVIKLAKLLSSHSDIYLLGKADNYQVVREGMIKIIEGSYIHAHAMPAGDLKHYVITLMESNTPVIATITKQQYKKDIINALSEVRARGAITFCISNKNNDVIDHWLKIPDSGDLTWLVVLVVFQLIAYYMALELGNNIDKPRNIAKSVTVL